MDDNPENRRQAERHYYRTQAICQRGRDGLGDVVNAQLLNLSKTGAQILLRGEFTMGEVFYLALVSPRRDTLAERRCVVRWRGSEGADVVRLGVAFDSELTEEQLAGVN